MELDFSQEWHVLAPRGVDPKGPAFFAAGELAATIGRCENCRPPSPGREGDLHHIILLDVGRSSAEDPGSGKGALRFSWRAFTDRVEINGEDEATLLRGVYDFLDALGARWVEPGDRGERLPSGPALALERTSCHSEPSSLPTTLVIGHGAYLEDWEDRLLWAARAGYSSIFIHTTRDALALGAAPEGLYEALRPSIADAARRLGLKLESGGHSLSSLLSRSLFGKEPALFREKNGVRIPDYNFCPSSDKALALASEAFAARAVAHPEISVFHAWPDDLPGGGWCSCPECSALSAPAQSLKIARALAASLASARPDAALSFLAYHDTEDIASVLESQSPLPKNLELLWAPRLRSWGSALSDVGNDLNAASLAAFRRAARAWRESGGGRIAVFEYWEDAVLFKGAVPPLTKVMEGDLAAYRGSDLENGDPAVADAISILCTGGRLPLGPRPNAYILPRLAVSGSSDSLATPAEAEGPRASEILAGWASAAYGPAASPMLEYWRELEAAWAIELDVEGGETALRLPLSISRYSIDPPADWGDPWMAGLERLTEKRGRCEELFDHLRLAESRLAEGRAAVAAQERPGADPLDARSRCARTVKGEAAEYAISGSILELDCARLSVYHELASGDARAAADIANLALSASGAVRKALSALPDRRSRREIGFLVEVFYDLRLRAIRRGGARSGIRRLLDLWYTSARTAFSALRVMRAYEPRGIAPATRKH